VWTFIARAFDWITFGLFKTRFAIALDRSHADRHSGSPSSGWALSDSRDDRAIERIGLTYDDRE